MRTALTIDGTRLLLHTDWAQPASAAVSINGSCLELVADPAGTLNGCTNGWAGVLSCNEGVLTAVISNTAEAESTLRSFSLRWSPKTFQPALPTDEFRELINGGSFLGMASGVKCVGRRQPPLDFVTSSSMLTVYQRDDGSALLLGILPPVSGGFSSFSTLHSAPHLEGDFGVAVEFTFDAVLGPGETVQITPLTAMAGTGGVDLIREYGAVFAHRQTRPVRRPAQIGWNSWDYRAGAITQQDMDINMDAARERFPDKLQIFCIDEGWEVQWGQWEPNGKFGHDLSPFVAHAQKRGFTPGIWTAPLLVNTYNPLFYENPDWFAADADGQLCTDTLAYGPMAYLDVTKPEVLEHIGGIFRNLKELGFQYFKVDFCHCILKAKKFSNPKIARNDLIRNAFRAIRKAIGDDAYLLACGAPYESVIDLVDAVRTTGDIHIYWGHILSNAGGIAARWWMHGNLWNCDPDFLVVRGPDTAVPPYFKRRKIVPAGPEGGWLAGREFNEAEARLYALLIHLSAGEVILGDYLPLLNDTGRAIIDRVLTPLTSPAVPVDLFTSDQNLPRIWIAREIDRTIVGLFNWSDKRARIDFTPSDYGVKGTAEDFWTGEPGGALPRSMERRSATAIVYR